MKKKIGIDQGISILSAANNAVAGVQNMVQQLKGSVANAKSATSTTEIDNVVLQYNDLRNQIDYLAADSAYQEINLVNGTGSTLQVRFSNETASKLTVDSVNITSGIDGISIAKLAALNATDPIPFHTLKLSAGTINAGD